MNIVIIGGSRGIGKAAARELLQDGHKVLIVGRNPKTLEETGKELAGAVTYSCDAGKAEETAGLVDAVKNGKIGVSLINPGGTFTETRKKSSEEDRSLLETSDLGKVIALTFHLSPQAVLEEVNIRPLQGDTY